MPAYSLARPGRPMGDLSPTAPIAAANSIYGFNRSAASVRSKSPRAQAATGNRTGLRTETRSFFVPKETAGLSWSLRWVDSDGKYHRLVTTPNGRRTVVGYCLETPSFLG